MSHRNIIEVGDALECLGRLPDGSAQCCISSPPYWSLRDYQVEGQYGLEKDPGEWVAKMVEVFREVKRVLRDDGVLFLNVGDSYASGGRGGNPTVDSSTLEGSQNNQEQSMIRRSIAPPAGLKPKDLIGLPWMLAFALRADGWWLRSDIIWHKNNPMPSSVKDRPTSAHEYIFLLSKAARYFYDAEAVREPSTSGRDDMMTKGLRTGLAYVEQAGPQDNSYKSKKPDGWATHDGGHGSFHRDGREKGAPAVIRSGRNARDVWTIPTQSFPGAHFATFPEELVRRCVLASTSEKGACAECGAPLMRIIENPKIPDELRNREGTKMDYHTRQIGGGQGIQDWREQNPPRTVGWKLSCSCGTSEIQPCLVIDIFMGSGTVGVVAKRLWRDYWGCDLNPEYVKMAEKRIARTAPAEKQGMLWGKS